MNELIKNISKEIMFEFDKNKKLGHMRCQYGRNSQIANQFISTDLFKEKSRNNEIKLQKIQEVVNAIQFDYVKNYDIIEDLCDGEETNFFLQEDNINYWIRLNPFGVGDYNCYIHIYHA